MRPVNFTGTFAYDVFDKNRYCAFDELDTLSLKAFESQNDRGKLRGYGNATCILAIRRVGKEAF